MTLLIKASANWIFQSNQKKRLKSKLIYFKKNTNNEFMKNMEDFKFIYLFLFVDNISDLKVDGCQSNLYVMLKQLLFFNKFYEFLRRWHSLMSRACYNILFQFMQFDNFLNFNRVILARWKQSLESQVNTFWYCFKVWNYNTNRNNM